MSWKARAALLALGLLIAGARAEAAQPFDRLPLEDQAYRTVQRLERAGYFTGAPNGSFNGRTLRTRYEFAVAVERVFRSFQPRVLAVSAPSTPANAPATLLEDLRLLRSLLVKFSDDIGALGPDVKDLEQQINSIEKRLLRMLADLPSSAADTDKRDSISPAVLAPTPPDSPLSFGVRSKLRRHLVANWLSQQAEEPMADLTRSPFGPSLKPGLAARLGPSLLGFDAEETDPLISDMGMPLADADSNHRTLRAHLTLPVGNYLATAFYNRLGINWDPFGQWSEFSGGPVENIGAQIAGPISNRVGFLVQGGSLSGLADDPTRVNYQKYAVNYELGRFHLDAGYERFRQMGLLGGITSSYYLGFGTRFGRAEWYARFRSGDNSSAVGQFSIRF